MKHGYYRCTICDVWCKPSFKCSHGSICTECLRIIDSENKQLEMHDV